MSRAALLLLFCMAAAPRVFGGEMEVRVAADREEVAFGEGFFVTVTLIWPRSLEPETLDDDLFLPLAAQLLDIKRRDLGDRMEETRRYACRAFSLDPVCVPPLLIKARSKEDGSPVTASGPGIRLKVVPALDPKAPGIPELPREMTEVHPSLGPWILGGLVLLSALAWIYLKTRWRGRVSSAAKNVVPPHRRALERLDQLRALEPLSPLEIDAFHVEASALVRGYVEERFRVPALERTTEELLQSPADIPSEPQTRLAAILSLCDRVKFEGLRPGREERSSLLDQATCFLLETAREDQA